jgi:FAD/FMN-containing dehydrogenase
MIALGVVAAVWLTGRRLEARGAGTRDDVSSMAVWAVTAGIIGARLYHVATDWSSFSGDPIRIFQIWKGGLGIPGGLLAGAVAGIWATKRRGVDWRQMADAAAPAIPLAQASDGPNIKHDIALPISLLADFVHYTDAKLAAALPGARPVQFGHLGDGNLHYNVQAPAVMAALDADPPCDESETAQSEAPKQTKPRQPSM